MTYTKLTLEIPADDFDEAVDIISRVSYEVSISRAELLEVDE